VNDAVITNRASTGNSDSINITSDYSTVPNSGILTNSDLTNNSGVGGDEGFTVDLRSQIIKGHDVSVS